MGCTAASLAPSVGASPAAHPAGTYTLMTPRIRISGLVVALLGVSLALPGLAAAGNGGAPAPMPGGTNGTVDPSFLLITRGSLYVGGILEISGVAANAANREVDIQSRDASGLWQPVAI